MNYLLKTLYLGLMMLTLSIFMTSCEKESLVSLEKNTEITAEYGAESYDLEERAKEKYRGVTIQKNDNTPQDIIKKVKSQIDDVLDSNLKQEYKDATKDMKIDVRKNVGDRQLKYDFRTKTYTIADWEYYKEIFSTDHVYMHELAHHISLHYFNQELNDKVVELWGAAGRSGKYPIDAYLLQNDFEYFAVNMEVFFFRRSSTPFTKGKLKSKDRVAFDFIKQNFVAGNNDNGGNNNNDNNNNNNNNDNNNNGIDCSGVQVYDSNKTYSVGQKVLYDGSIYKLTNSGWNNLGGCNTNNGGGSVCDGVPEWNSNKNYSVGKKVTLNGVLYKLTNSGWKIIGNC